MGKHYLEELIKIFEKEKKVTNIIISDEYVSKVTDLFDLTNCNIFALQAIRDAVVSRLSDMKLDDLTNRYFYAEVVSYVTTIIDEQIYKKGGIV